MAPQVAMTATKTGNLNSISGTHTVEEKNQLLEVVTVNMTKQFIFDIQIIGNKVTWDYF